VELRAAAGSPLTDALKEAGLSEATFRKARARLLQAAPRDLNILHDAWRAAERTIIPAEYVGRTLHGICPVCGQQSTFQNFNENLRESGACQACGSGSRNRQMAFVLRERLGLASHGVLEPSEHLKIHNTESTGAVHAQLKGRPNYTFSEYWGPSREPGEIVEGVRHEDLQALSFPDQSLDVILSSDVLEHMPYPYRAHAEIFRALKPGGAHIFTAPFHGSFPDDVRARIEGEEIVYLGEKLFHGDPIRPAEGVLVWTIFGMEMLDQLRALGFEAVMWKFSDQRLGIPDAAIVFEARKPVKLGLARCLWGLARRLARLAYAPAFSWSRL
jgi:SAM-dependent methyltransferase